MSAPTEDPAVPTDVEQKTESDSASSRSSSNNNVIACSTCKTPQTKTFVLKKCSCRAAQYCNTKCQKKHRKAHKEICRHLTAERKLEKKQKEKTKSPEKEIEEGERKDNNNDNNVKAAPKKEGEKEEGDECPICLDILPKDPALFNRWTCCGKGIHTHCFKDMESMSMAGNCPFCRAKTPTSDGEAVKYLRPWVKKKKAWALTMMGGKYAHGVLGVKQSYEMAKRLFEQAAQLGDVSAMSNLGLMYHEGEGVEQSYERAKEYYEQAAQLGFADAQYALGRMYALGEGIDKDTMKAKALWTTSAAQGNENAINVLKQIDEHQGRTTLAKTASDSNTIVCSNCETPQTSTHKLIPLIIFAIHLWMHI